MRKMGEGCLIMPFRVEACHSAWRLAITPRGSTGVKKGGWQHERVGAGVKGGGLADLSLDMRRGGTGHTQVPASPCTVNIARGVQGKDN